MYTYVSWLIDKLFNVTEQPLNILKYFKNTIHTVFFDQMGPFSRETFKTELLVFALYAKRHPSSTRSSVL